MHTKRSTPSPVWGRAEGAAAPGGSKGGGNSRLGEPDRGVQVGDAAHELGRERVLDIQRVRILAGMVEVSAERGAGNVTVAHIVARAGVSRRTFYELFSDCEDCFLGAFDEGVARASRHVLDGYDPGARWAVRVRASLIALLSFLDAEPYTGQLLVIGSLGAGTRTLQRRQNVLARLLTAVDEGRQESKSAAELPPLTAEGIVGGVLSVLHSRLLSRVPPTAKARHVGASASPTEVGSRTEDTNGDSLACVPSRGVPERGLLALTGPLMGMIVLPYLGPAAARRENAQPIPKNPPIAHHPQGNPLGQLEMRLTYRTVRVLMAIAAQPGSSNRIVAEGAEVSDQGQMSKLLARLEGLGLIHNTGGGATRGEPNAWRLTEKGRQVQEAIAEQTSHA